MKTVGNALAIQHTRKAIQFNISNTILLYGPRGVGKRTCVHELIEEHFDKYNIFKFGVEGKGCLHSVSSMKSVIEHAYSFPLIGNRLCFVFDDADRMGPSVIAKLLKLTEQPDMQTLIILVSSNPGLMPKTLMSRSIRIPFFELSKEDIISVIHKESSLIDSSWFKLGSIGKIMSLVYLQKHFDLSLINKITSFPVSTKDFLDCISKMDVFTKLLAKQESESKLAIQELFWEILTLKLSSANLPTGLSVNTVLRHMYNGIQCVDRGLSIINTLVNTWIETGIVNCMDRSELQ